MIPCCNKRLTGTVHNTYGFVGNTWRKFWKLVQLQKDDAPKVWEARTVNNEEVWWMWWPAHAPNKMDQSLWQKSPAWMGTLILSYPRCHPKKLVYRDRTPTWYGWIGYLVWGIIVNVLIWRPVGEYYWQCAASYESYHFQIIAKTTRNSSTNMVSSVKLGPRMS